MGVGNVNTVTGLGRYKQVKIEDVYWFVGYRPFKKPICFSKSDDISYQIKLSQTGRTTLPIAS